MFKSLEYLLLFFILSALFVLVIANVADSSSYDDQRIIDGAVKEFSDTVRELGYISPSHYDKFMAVVRSFGTRASVRLEHRKKRYEPIYSNPNNFSTFSGDFTSFYDDFYTNDILKVVYPEDTTIPYDSLQRHYNLSQGDLFFVRVELYPSYAERLKSALIRGSSFKTTYVGGGLVHDES